MSTNLNESREDDQKKFFIKNKKKHRTVLWCYTWRKVTCSSTRTSLDRLVENWRRDSETHKRNITFSTSEISTECEKSRGMPQFLHCCVFLPYTVKRQICAWSVFTSFLETCVENELTLGSSCRSLSVHDLSVIFVHKTTAMILSSGKGQLSILYSISKKLKKGVEAQIKRGRDTTGALKGRLGCAELSRNHPH